MPRNPDRPTPDEPCEPDHALPRSRGATRVDEEIGLRIRRRRVARDVTQRQLARDLGISPQQVQKYETAENRMPVQLLLQIATALRTPIEYFLQNLQGIPVRKPQRSMKALATEMSKIEEVGEELMSEQRLIEDSIRQWSSLAVTLKQAGSVDAQLQTDILAQYDGISGRVRALMILSTSLSDRLTAGRERLKEVLQAVRPETQSARGD